MKESLAFIYINSEILEKSKKTIVQVGGNMDKPMADSSCSLVETNTIL